MNGTGLRGGAHMSGSPSCPYALLREERQLLSAANLTHANVIRPFEPPTEKEK